MLDSPTPVPSPGRMIARGLTRRCPLCGERRIFRRYLVIVERCPRCGHRFNRRPEEAFFLGAFTINVAVGLLTLGLALVAYGFARAGLLPGSRTGFLVVALTIAVAVPLLFYPVSYTLWSAIDLVMHPPEPVEQAEAATWLADHPAAPPRPGR